MAHKFLKFSSAEICEGWVIKCMQAEQGNFGEFREIKAYLEQGSAQDQMSQFFKW